MLTAVVGWLSVLAAWAAFGTFAVPIKSATIRRANVHPVIYQLAKTTWVGFGALFSIAFTETVVFTPWGLLSGLLWVPAGVAAVYAVPRAGVSVAQGVWSGIGAIVPFVWGVAFFNERVASLEAAFGGLSLLVCGVVLMSAAPALLSKKDREEAESDSAERDDFAEGERTGLLGETAEQSVNQSTATAPKKRATAPSRGDMLRGIAAAVFNGVWGGSVMTPLLLARRDGALPGKHNQAMEYMLSFFVGSAVVNVALVFAVLIRARVAGDKMPSLHLSNWRVQAAMSASGFLWTAGW
jgi:multidrug transporter EmrE-like cation transporter